jgi:predicted enzyme related to lactoylglutathione lyase
VPDVLFISAIIILSSQPSSLAQFYRRVLRIPLEKERHGPESSEHYACELGDVHFAIHHGTRNSSEVPPFKLAIAVTDLSNMTAHIAAEGYTILYPPEDLGFAVMTALRDPDGNYIELTELSEVWMRHLLARRESGADPVMMWRRSRENGGG